MTFDCNFVFQTEMVTERQKLLSATLTEVRLIVSMFIAIYTNIWSKGTHV